MFVDRRRQILLGALGFVMVVAAWWIVAVTVFASNGVVPAPPTLVDQLAADGATYYVTQIGITLSSAAQGFIWGVLVAFALAAVVMLIPRSHTAVSQFALFIECAPAAAIGPVVLALAGGRTPSIFLAAVGVFFTTLVGTLLGLRAARVAELEVIRVYGGGSWAMFRKVRLMATLPAALTALKVAVPAAIMGAIIGEYLGGVDSGIGVALAVAQRSIQVERTWIFGLSAAALTSIGYALFALLGRVALPWARTGRTR
ncbi:ABC transporter permease [Agromyces sp. MMS24-JH15]|uniref:ABC transporter permease n=1 Tax=Agromyces sp. MMS24-JH15 TaxID=3243765 RepID=UPI003749A140